MANLDWSGAVTHVFAMRLDSYKTNKKTKKKVQSNGVLKSKYLHVKNDTKLRYYSL